MRFWPFISRRARKSVMPQALVLRAKPACHLLGRFDAAQTTGENRRH